MEVLEKGKTRKRNLGYSVMRASIATKRSPSTRTQISLSPLSDMRVKRAQSLYFPGQAKTAEIGNLHGALIAWAPQPIIGCTGPGYDHP